LRFKELASTGGASRTPHWSGARAPSPASYLGQTDSPGEWIEVEHGRRALAIASRNFYEQPDERVHFTGITGTNGKTTTSFLIDAILRAAGFVTGLMGTIEYRLAGKSRTAVNTTPRSLDTLRFAAELYAQGGTHLTMEVSSHALALERVYGFHFHTPSSRI
jgi:UDP-N-acetylmuramoyl-L-alanyl-D-glutamate--2,6-diaminopimelate ligase